MASQTQAHPWRWWLHVFTVLYFTMSFVVRFTWPPVISLAAPELGMKMSGAGAYMSAFFIGYVLTQFPGGVLSDRFGSRFVFCAALVLEGLGSIGLSFAPDFTTGFLFRVLTGLGGGMVFASCVRFIMTIFPARETGLAFGFLLMAPSGVGVIVPNLLMPWLLSMVSWRGAFFVVGCLGIGMGLLALAVVRDRPAKKLEQKSFAGLLTVLRHPKICFLGLVGFWLVWLTVGFITWGNTRVKNLGFSMEEAAMVMIAFGIGGVLGSPAGGFAVQKTRSIRNVLMLLFLVLVPLTWLFYEHTSLQGMAWSAAALGFGIGFANPFMPMLTARYFPRELMGTAGGVTGCMYQLGAVFSPLVMGYGFDVTGDFTLAWKILAAVPAMAFLSLIPLKTTNSK